MANKGNPAWKKGGPSPNPRGRSVAKAAGQAPGYDGVISYGGQVQQNEGSPRLLGVQKWKEFANAYFFAPVAIAVLLRNALLAGTSWSLQENPAGGELAKRGLDVVQRGLLEARLPKPWTQVVRKAEMRFFNGFSLHATAMARRPDGLVSYTDIAHRPPHTIDGWLREGRDNVSGPFVAVQQRLPNGAPCSIQLNQCLYLVHDAIGDAPDGTGMLRLVVEYLRRVGLYKILEGSELFSSMAGTPIARVPLNEITKGMPQGLSEEEAAAYKRAKVANIENVVRDRVKSPETRQYLVLDSATYQGSDPNTISGVQKFSIEMLKGELQGLPEIRKIITDEELNVARMLGVEFAFSGGGDSTGSFGMHESKTDLFASSLQTGLGELGACADDQLVRPLVIANGLDPDLAAPSLVAAPIYGKDVEKIARTMGLIAMAGLPPNHPAKIAMFKAMEMPWQDEGAPLMVPRFGSNPGGMP